MFSRPTAGCENLTAPFATEDVRPGLRPGLRLGPSPLGKIPSEWSEYGASVESSLEGWVIGATPVFYWDPVLGDAGSVRCGPDEPRDEGVVVLTCTTVASPSGLSRRLRGRLDIPCGSAGLVSMLSRQ